MIAVSTDSRFLDALARLKQVQGLSVREGVALREHTRFGIGGAADLFATTPDPAAFAAAVRCCRRAGLPHYVLGDGSNVVVSEKGFRGAVLRYTGRGIELDGTRLVAGAGAQLQALIDFAIAAGLRGIETLAGIPGSVGGAIYGNAGAYGHSISERVESVQIFDGEEIRELDNPACEFDYRESLFKRHKGWTILTVRLAFDRGDPIELRREADEIMAVRDKKFPPTMCCAGSIFKNLHVRDLPPDAAAEVPSEAIRDGKVASAYFLERVGAKGMRRGGIEIAHYHANLIYNAGGGTADDLRALILELKHRVRERFGFEVEEEVQYVGEFDPLPAGSRAPT